MLTPHEQIIDRIQQSYNEIRKKIVELPQTTPKDQFVQAISL
jgi:hypothetical protein